MKDALDVGTVAPPAAVAQRMEVAGFRDEVDTALYVEEICDDEGDVEEVVGTLAQVMRDRLAGEMEPVRFRPWVEPPE